MIVAYCLLEREARHWRLQPCRGAHLPPGIISVLTLVQRLKDRFLPRPAVEHIVGELRSVKQATILSECHREKY